MRNGPRCQAYQMVALAVLDLEVSGDQCFCAAGLNDAEIGIAREVDRLRRAWGLQPYQVSLAWLLSCPAVASVIAGTETVGELRAAAAVDLDAASSTPHGSSHRARSVLTTAPATAPNRRQRRLTPPATPSPATPPEPTPTTPPCNRHPDRVAANPT